MAPGDVTLSMEGQATDYPFDRHQATMWIYAVSPSKDATSLDEAAPVPIALDLTGKLPGLKLDAALNEADSSEEFQVVDFTITRAGTVIFFSIFVMAAMWALALSAVLVAVYVLFSARKAELGMLSWMAALLFAFPNIRNAVPGTPPIGSLVDFLAFFWAEALAAVALLCVAAVWLFRPQK